MAEEKESSDAEATTENEEKRSERMKPWEQHGGVISMPRFDYNAPSALLNQSHSGFLITCSIKREKSATKEAMSILQKYVGSYNNEGPESLDNSSVNNSSKRRKIFADEIDGKCSEGLEGELSKEYFHSLAKTDTTVDSGVTFSLVKLAKSGLLLLIFPKGNYPDTVATVSNIFQNLEGGTLRTPLWCHRIFPIQATCCLNEKELQTVVSKLVLEFMNMEQKKLTLPVKFAIGYNRRGIEETQLKSMKDASADSDLFSLLDRNKCFNIVASAVKDVISESAVDLKSPDLSILVELLPLSGAPSGSLVAAVSVLPQNLVSTKPRLCIRPLVPDVKLRNGKN